MDDIFVNGFWRMDWGLGNPNKTAALIATLMVAVWALAYVRRWGFWVALVLFSGLGICLVHTFSRGGLVAVVLGLVPVIVMLRRPWSRSRMLGVLAAIWVIVGASVFLQAHERYGQGVVQEDHSISNRLEIWKTTPQMMVDAPGGWGIGNSGLAYMNWYQPLDQHEGYRTLVNSHLTWLVEFGWPGRILYIAGWVTVFFLCFPTKRTPWLAVPFGIWVAFFVGALFSSVAESVWLWVVPSLALGIVLIWRMARRQWPSRSTLLLPPAIAAASCVLLMAVIPGSAIRKEGQVVKIGSSSPAVWVVADTSVLGKQPGRSVHRIQSDVKMRRAFFPSADFFAFEQSGCSVLDAFSDDDLAGNIHEVEHAADGVTGGSVGQFLFSLAQPL